MLILFKRKNYLIKLFKWWLLTLISVYIIKQVNYIDFLNRTSLARYYSNLSINESIRDQKYIFRDLHPPNLTLINITNFEIPINVNICNVTDITIVTLIHTACEHKEARDIIRKTWGSPDIPNVSTRLVFLVGLTSDEAIQRQIANESLTTGDLVQGGFVDNYRNMSYKNLFGRLWVSTFCQEAEFVMKTDDDMFVDLYAVYTISRTYLSHQNYLDDKFILCPVHTWMPVLRDPKNKWGINYSELPRNLVITVEGYEREYYPKYCPGAFEIMNPGTAGKLAEMGTHPKELQFLWIDDAWMGYLAKDLNITHLDIRSEFFTLRVKKMVLMESVQNPYIYHKNFIVGPNVRDFKFFTQRVKKMVLMESVQNPYIYHKSFIVGPNVKDLKTSLALHKLSRWCYFNGCLSNIYKPNRNLTSDDLNHQQVLDRFFPE